MTYKSAAEADAAPIPQKALPSTRVELEPIGLTEHGRRYRVTYAGEVLTEGRRNPIFDACRALLARGITGRLEVWRRGKTSADMQLDIEPGALFAIRETARESIRLVPWEPLPPHTGAASPNAFPYRRPQPPAAICASPVGGVAYPGTNAGPRSLRCGDIRFRPEAASRGEPGAKYCPRRSFATRHPSWIKCRFYSPVGTACSR